MRHMETIIKRVKKGQLDKDSIEMAGAILKKGGLVAFPTETVYGLGADALNEKAAEKIYAAKGRPSDNPLIVHITNLGALEKITKNVPEETKKIADAYWPGPLTMIFEKSEAVPYGTTGGLDTVAVRMPSDEVARALIDVGGGYIAAPSANTSGRPSPTMAEHVEEDLTGRIDMILDGGPVSIGLESTMLEACIDEVTVDKAVIKPNQRPKAPGMKYRHYAPKADLSIVEGEMSKVISKINELAAEQVKAGHKVGIIGTEESVANYICGDVKSIGTREDESTIAVHLFAILREFDADQVDYIYSESFDTEGIGSAIMNRLLKAAGHHVITV